ncbi:hypothetical protein DFH07DRAFT_1009091 [Mycena maculata]|uniref:Uncharacterized protein n=1 Tax=Mycena maculata TaxID=230809 RepID=A0AAD7HG99_9AGAR|nr:hypothetical protein DFH07DRAFT_1009091 [Mycena maculata]
MYSRKAPNAQTARFPGHPTGSPTARSTGANNPFSHRFNAVASLLGVPVSSDKELDELLHPFAKRPEQLASLKATLIASAEASVPPSGRFPVFGETPEESGEAAFQTLRLDAGLNIRFFCGGSPSGMLFFDFVDTRTGRPVNLPAGYSVYQRMSEGGDIRLVPMHEVFGYPRMDLKARFVLRENSGVSFRMPSGKEYHLISPIIPRP